MNNRLKNGKGINKSVGRGVYFIQMRSFSIIIDLIINVINILD